MIMCSYDNCTLKGDYGKVELIVNFTQGYRLTSLFHSLSSSCHANDLSLRRNGRQAPLAFFQAGTLGELFRGNSNATIGTDRRDLLGIPLEKVKAHNLMTESQRLAGGQNEDERPT